MADSPCNVAPKPAAKPPRVGFSVGAENHKPRTIVRQQTPGPSQGVWRGDEDDGDHHHSSEKSVYIDPAALEAKPHKTLQRKATPLCMTVDDAAVQHARQMRIWGEKPPDAEKDKQEIAQDL